MGNYHSSMELIVRGYFEQSYILLFTQMHFSQVLLFMQLTSIVCLQSYVTCCLGIWMVGMVFICFGVSNSLFSFIFGRLTKHTGQPLIIAIGNLAFIGNLASISNLASIGNLASTIPTHYFPCFSLFHFILCFPCIYLLIFH